MNRHYMTVCREDYPSREEFENAIKRAVCVLLENNYIMTVKWDEKGFGIVAIEFDYDDVSYGCPYPVWLTCEEQDMIDLAREEKENGEVILRE